MTKHNLITQTELITKTGITVKSLAMLRKTGKIYYFKNHDNTFLYLLEDVLKEKEKNPDLFEKNWKKDTYRAVDLFAGIGGLRLGFQQAFGDRCEFVFSNEIDKNCCITYKDYFGDDPRGDITQIDPKMIPDFDILLAGFPCQPFSIAGRREGFGDKLGRGNMFYYIADILKIKKPVSFLLENVKNLVTHDKGRTFAVIQSILENELGYSLNYKVLNAKYYNLPQNRQRIFIVGFKQEVDFDYPEATEITTMKIGDILQKKIDPKYYISQRYWDTLIKHRARHEGKGNGFGYEVLDRNGVANALVVGGMGRERNLIKDNIVPEPPKNKDGIRVLTPRECARIQGFPDDFRIPVCDTQAYRQFANSVPVPVVRLIAEKMFHILDEN